MLTTLSPVSIPAGTATSTTVTATGTNFVTGATVQVNGSPRATAFVSGTQLTFKLTAGDRSVGANLSVAVVNPPPGGGTSAAALLPITNPVPTVTQLAPATLSAGSAATNVTVMGSNFVSTTVIQAAGSARPTTFVSATQVTAFDLASAGSLSITAVNPAPGGGTSSAATLVVVPAATVLSSVTPNQIVVNSPDTTISVLGSGLTSLSIVQWNGTSLATSYGFCYSSYSFATCLTAIVPASLLTAEGTASVTVYTPTLTPSVSNILQVAVIKSSGSGADLALG